MSFYPDEIERIEEAELWLMGASAQDLGYEVMSLQLIDDVMEIRHAKDCLKEGKMPT